MNTGQGWIGLLLDALSNHMVLIVCCLVILILSYCLFVYISAVGQPQVVISTKPARKISPIRESDEENGTSRQVSDEEEEESEGASRFVSVGGSVKRMKKKKTRKKMESSDGLARKIYKRLVKPPESSLVSGDSETTSSRPQLRRRHSTGPLQLARAAREFIVRGGPRRYFRQFSEIDRSALPRPPSEFFEPSDLPEIPSHLKPEIFYILDNIKMLELPSDWKLDPREVEVMEYQEGQYVIRPGDDDDAVIVVLDGALAVRIAPDGMQKDYQVKRLERGQSLFSMLSMIDILMGNTSIFRTVSAQALERSRIARYRIYSFRESFLRNPRVWTRPVQIVITRLLHVTMTTLHQYLGLSSELIKKRIEEKRVLDGDRHRHLSGMSVGGSIRMNKLARPRQRRLSSTDDSVDVLAMARRWFMEALGLSGPEGLALVQDRITLELHGHDELLIEQGSDQQTLLLVIAGSLKIYQEPIEMDDEDRDDDPGYSLILVKEMFGGLQLLTSEPSFYNVKTNHATTLAVISKQHFAELLELRPEIVLPVAYSMLRRLSSFLRGVDFALDWILLDSGHSVYRQGDKADSLFVVLSGRLRSVEKKTVIEEFGRGDMMGMVEVLQRKPRMTTVLAVRFSQLARIPEGLLNYIKLQYPQVGFRLVRLLGQYYSSEQRRMPLLPGLTGALEQTGSSIGDANISHIKNLHTIAVIAVSKDVPLVAFTCELYHALNASVKVLRLSSSKVAENLDASVLDRSADFRLMHWLNVQEDTFPLVIYECDVSSTEWTRRCLRQADAILVIANGADEPPSKEFMEEYLNMTEDGLRTSKELILLWKEDVESPTGTFEWLKSGSWFSGHHHVRAPNRMYRMPKASERDVIDFYEQNIFGDKFEFNSDFARLARILTGNAVGLVLGGGGARGAAHVGVIKAMRELGIPVDIVGGTSIGSLVGGLFAESVGDDFVKFEQRAKSWFQMMTSLWRKIWDLTYAHSAMFTGAGFNRTVQALFGDRDIDDLWLPYFAIATDISTSEMRICRSGPLWAYCRASMSLAGFLPPLCSPNDGHLLVDGGYINNLPADVMRSMGARCVIAVDVGSATENNLYNYGESLSGFWVLMKRLNPWGEAVRVLTMEEIQSRLAYVSCVRQLELVKKAPYCHYLRPPIEQYKTLDFGKFDAMRDIGYEYGLEILSGLVASNENIQAVMNPDKLRLLSRQQRRDANKLDRTLASSFTDMAAIMSKIPKLRRNSVSEFPVSEDELAEDYESSEMEASDNEEAVEQEQTSTTPMPDPNIPSDLPTPPL